jgi:hypothetical protein
MRLVDKTIANCKEVVEATDVRAQSKFAKKNPAATLIDSELEKQRIYVDSSLNRCRRCGDHTPTFLPTAPLALICADCENTLKNNDKAMWFVELLAKTGMFSSTKEGEKE